MKHLPNMCEALGPRAQYRKSWVLNVTQNWSKRSITKYFIIEYKYYRAKDNGEQKRLTEKREIYSTSYVQMLEHIPPSWFYKQYYCLAIPPEVCWIGTKLDTSTGALCWWVWQWQHAYLQIKVSFRARWTTALLVRRHPPHCDHRGFLNVIMPLPHGRDLIGSRKPQRSRTYSLSPV